MLCQHLVIGDRIVLHGARVNMRAGAVDAVDVLGEQNRIRADLGRAQHRRCVGRKIRAAAAGAEKHDLALFQMRNGALPRVVLGKGRHLDRRLHAHGNALLFHHIGHGKAVHHGRQHTHVVGARAGHFALTVFHAAPEVAAADDDAHLHAAEVEQDFKSQNAFVVAAINDYYERHLAKKNDPYLESREKEDAFADRLVQTVEQKLLSNLPALAAMYQMQQQAFFQAGLQAGGIMSYPYQQGNPGAEASVGVKLVTEPIQGSEQPIEVVKQELSEPEENEFLDYSFGV